MGRRGLISILACVLISACGGGPEDRAQDQTLEETTRTLAERTEEDEKGPRTRQQATYYGDELAGNPTASGEPYDPRDLTAAHKTLPFGAVLEVCYRGCTRVRINDRNPASEADLDLSRAAADRIGLTADGVGTVEAEVASLPRGVEE